MNARGVLIVLASVAMAVVCVRLGFWQLSRLDQKRALNAARLEAQNSAPVDLESSPPPFEQVRNRRVRARGRYDQTHHFVLAGHALEGSPGVHLVTPLVLPSGAAVLVDRGWLHADDAATARPQDVSEPGEVMVLGISDSIPKNLRGATWLTLESDSVQVWSMMRLALDSLRAHLPYAIAPYLVCQLPGPGVPALPRRTPPEPANEGMHLGYAFQWFLFAFILLAGPPAVLRSQSRDRERRDRPVTRRDAGPRPPGA